MNTRVTAAESSGVHREAFALPVGAKAEAFELLVDAMTVLLAPPPGAREERVAAEPVTREAFLRQLAHEYGFGGDRGVILTRQPVRVIAAHPMVAREHVHRRVGGAVPEMRGAGDVRRRHRDDERRPRGVDVGVKDPASEVARD